MRILVIFGVVGQLLRLFSLAFVPPLVYAVVTAKWVDAGSFLAALAATLLFGFLFSHKFKAPEVFHREEALAVVAFTWLGIGLFGAIPYMLHGLSFVDSLFESISGFTTTGATILTDFSAYDHPFYLWRSMTQWFGGLGVIALFVIVLPRLGIAGRQLFFAESSSAPGEAVSPTVRSSASRLWILYTGLTALLIALLFWAGMTPFDAICHALTTLAAGGFSPNGQSIAGYANPTVEWILIVFMILAGASFPLTWTVLSRRPLEYFRDGEFGLYFGVTVIGGIGVGALVLGGLPDMDAIRMGLFQSASLISSTGFASADFNLWGDDARVLLIFIMLVGGCAGSAAGGPKAVRHLLVIKHVFAELTRTIHPRAVIPIKYKGRAVDPAVMRAVFTLVVVYVGSYFMFGMVLSLMGYDLVTAFSAALACTGNVGPAFGEAGPMGSFSFFSTPAKLVLTAAMWVGRLEIVTVLALLHPHVLRGLRLRG